ncbi:hypothetical protein [Bacillus sp. D386]|uniref:hypothetical protein n=1 Tax=Bacillus sp. D386 TaxID=2587155 RepID=UPI0015D655B8|nr:hypothetical protein [Bacillus sp. D386]
MIHLIIQMPMSIQITGRVEILNKVQTTVMMSIGSKKNEKMTPISTVLTEDLGGKLMLQTMI